MAVVKCSKCGKQLVRLPDIQKGEHEHGCPEPPPEQN